MTEPVEVALVTGLCVGGPTLILGILNFITNLHTGRKISTIEENTNNKLDELLGQRNAATTRADSAEGKLAGTKAEQERKK